MAQVEPSQRSAQLGTCACVFARVCACMRACVCVCLFARSRHCAMCSAGKSAHRARTARYGPAGAPAQTEGCGDDRAMKRVPIRMCVRCIERAVNHAAAAEAASRPGTAASCSMGCGGSLCRDMLHGVTLQRVAQREPVRGFAIVAWSCNHCADLQPLRGLICNRCAEFQPLCRFAIVERICSRCADLQPVR